MEFTESLTTMSGLFSVIVLLALTGMLNKMVMLLSLLSFWIMLVSFVCISIS